MKKLNSILHDQKAQGSLIITAFFGIIIVVLALTWNA